MSEHQVRDAYMLAARIRDRRPSIWEEHRLPMALPASETPWLTLAAVPEEPLADILDTAETEPNELAPQPEELGAFRHFSVAGVVSSLGRWADGYFGDDSYGREGRESTIVRLHRDGAAGIADACRRDMSVVLLARMLNADLTYVSWFWTKFDLRRPVELRIRLEHVHNMSLNVGASFHDENTVREPTGVTIDQIAHSEFILPEQLGIARYRHRIVQNFTNRVRHAFGLGPGVPLFRTGQLYGEAGTPLSVSAAGRGVWTTRGQALARVYDDGTVRGVDENQVWHWVDGALLDPNGETVGVVEMAPGEGCPDDFRVVNLLDDPRARVPGGNAGEALPAPAEVRVPAPTRTWSTLRPTDLAPDLGT